MRHPNHDYSGGAYFITFSTYHRIPLLGTLNTGVFCASPAGQVVLETWNEIPERFDLVTLDVIQLMPDHVHCILILNSGLNITVECGTNFVPDLICWFKGRSSYLINRLSECTGKVWEHGYHDRIIRNESELEKFRNYIQTNPFRSTL